MNTKTENSIQKEVVGAIEQLYSYDFDIENSNSEETKKTKMAYMIAKRLRKEKALQVHDIDGFIWAVETIREVIEAE